MSQEILTLQERIRQSIQANISPLVEDPTKQEGVSTLKRIIQGEETTQIDYQDETSIVFDYGWNSSNVKRAKASYYRGDELIGTYSVIVFSTCLRSTVSELDKMEMDRNKAYLEVLVQLQPQERITGEAGEVLDNAGLAAYTLTGKWNSVNFYNDPEVSLPKLKPEKRKVFVVEYK
ncbi:hypothetical protein GF327_07330 [Candidatus Woesearchaeota archaeon]|nr:hypothetical protein [Candidatus Woesearchaeota archaeon]